MSATFRSRIFRLLLLFAAVPSIILTVLGYYLTTESEPGAQTTVATAPEEVQNYFLDRVYAEIEAALQAGERDSAGLVAATDFVIRLDSTATEVESSSGPLPRGDLENVRLAVRGGAARGLIASGNGFNQFALRRTAGEILVGGVIHDSSFVRLVESARASSATRSAERELHSRYVVFLGLLFLTVTLVAILAAYFFSARVSRHLAEPVTALSRAAERIASGDFRQQVAVAARDELGSLVASFNVMAAHLDETTARLAQTERVAAWRHVARRFAHELKNPLQPILVSLYRIEQQLSGSPQWEQIKEPLKAAGEEVKHLTALADRFSSLAKLPPPNLADFDLNGLISSITDLYTDRLRPFRFALELPEESVRIRSDAAYLREALHNLLQNALDACRAGDGLTVRLAVETETVEITVADTGPGMDDATLASARLPYFTTKAKGNGLGLAIVERSMAELGGQLKVESRPNEGTTVTLILPKGERDVVPNPDCGR